jgi:CBS domain-containing protein
MLLVSADRSVLDRLEAELGPRYTPQYRLVRATSKELALAAVERLEADGELIALVISDLDLGAIDQTIRCVSPAEAEHQRLDDLLDDWMSAARIPYLQVRDVMETRVARIGDGDNLHHAAEIVALSGVGDLMVVDREHRFVGVLSEGDILRNALPDLDQIIEAGGTLHQAYQLFLRKGVELAKRPITDLVIRDPLVMHPDDHVAKAAVVMVQRQIRRLPVIEDGRLVGTVSRASICQAVVGTF